MLENLFSQLNKPVTPVTPVTPEKTKTKTQIKTDVETRSNSSGLDLHYCRECQNLNLRGYCTKQRFRPVDDMPRNCSDFMPNGKPAPNCLSLPEKNAILRWLTYIGENNPDIINEVMDYCASDPVYREYYLKRSTEAPH